jgi:hypothetical protein
LLSPAPLLSSGYLLAPAAPQRQLAWVTEVPAGPSGSSLQVPTLQAENTALNEGLQRLRGAAAAGAGDAEELRRLRELLAERCAQRNKIVCCGKSSSLLS